MPVAAGAASRAEECFVGTREPLRAADAVAALLILDDGRYVMQLRDTLPTIFYPDHWGCFGGAVGDGEAPLAALKRELQEELEYTPGAATEFARFDFDFSSVGQPKVYRIYYEIHVPATAFRRFVLHEGAAFEAIGGRDLLTQRKVTPYDAYAVWMHLSKQRFNQA
ncbi:MAG: NUDIX domain-containing protein [Betaproteobacteria bacterium]